MDMLIFGLSVTVVGMLIVEFGSVGKAPRVEMRTLEQMADFYRREGI